MWTRIVYLLLLSATCFESGAQELYPERIFAQTDRSFYLSGESLFFSVLAQEAATGTAAKSRVVQVELIDPDKTPVLQTMVQLQQGRGAGELKLPDLMPSGVFTLRIYSTWMKNWGEAGFFQQSVIVLNPYDTAVFKEASGRWNAEAVSSTASVAVQLDAASYSKRALVTGSLQVPEGTVFAALTISVLPAAEPVLSGIQGSSMQAPIHSGQLMHLPELEGPLLKARISDAKTGTPLENRLLTLVQPGSNFVISVAKSNREGICWFNPGLSLASGELVVQPVHSPQDGQLSSIELFPLFSPVEQIREQAFPALPKSQLELFRQRFVQLQLEQAFRIEKRNNNLNGLDSFPLGRPDKSYRLDQFTRFGTMQEIFREYISEVRVRKSDSSFQVRVRNKWIPGFFETEPLLLLDGIPVWNANQLMEMDPRELASIDIYTQKLLVGNLVREGVLVCKTYEGKANAEILGKDALIITFPGIQGLHKTIDSAATQNLRQVPDRRSLLYWDPYLESRITNSRIPFKFSTADQAGSYKLLIRGIDNSGQNVEWIHFFEVR